MFPRMQLKHWPTHFRQHAVAGIGRASNLYVTAREPTTEPSEAAPASVLHAADISALLPQVGLPTVHVRQHQREVCRLSPWGDLAAVAQPLSGLLQTGLRLLSPPVPAAPSARLAVRFPSQVALLGRRRAYHVPPVSQCGEGRASPPVVRQLRRGSSEPPDLTTYLLVQAIQHLALGLCDDV